MLYLFNWSDAYADLRRRPGDRNGRLRGVGRGQAQSAAADLRCDYDTGQNAALEQTRSDLSRPERTHCAVSSGSDGSGGIVFNTNITTGIAVAHGRGIILLSGYQAGLQIYGIHAAAGQAGGSSVMAVRTKSRSWTWCVASCPCRPCRSRTTRRTPSLSRSAMRAAPHL